MRGTFCRLAAAAGLALVATTTTRLGRAAEPTCGDAVSCFPAICSAVSEEDAAADYWIAGEYLVWQVSGMNLPPLVTASPANTPLADAGELGRSTTSILAGNERVLDGWRSGFALEAGYWLNPCRGTAIVGDYFNAGRDSYGYTLGPGSGDIITRPFFNTEDDAQDAQQVDVPDQLAGTVRVQAFSDFQGAGAALQTNLWCCDKGCGRSSYLAVVGGYRYYQFDSLIRVDEDLTVLPNTTTPLVPGTTIDLYDRFETRNVFHGGEIGVKGRWQRSEWWFDGLAMLAIGGNRRDVWIDGQTTNTVPNAGSSAAAGGLLTSSVTNIGHYSDTQAVVIPRFRLGVGCQVTQRIAVRAGYNVILWNDVVQADDTLPPGLRVDPRNLPPVQAGGGPDPAFPGILGSALVAHGADVGLQLDF
jgi:hypothetical protein